MALSTAGAIRRRTVLGLGAAAAVLGGGAALSRLLAPRRDPPPGLIREPGGHLLLADGFRCVVLQRTGDRMSDGHRAPSRPDGMGCFPQADGSVVLMRNHELLPDDDGPIDRDHPPPEAFDAGSQGCVSRLVVDVAALRRGSADVLRASNLVLAGTNFNCAGGRSPWGWLSCEEDVSPGHGFVFVCPTDAERLAPPRPIRAWGRLRHEGAAVDPATHAVYLTEDREDACLYRCVPRSKEQPFEGRLEALALMDGRGGALGGSIARGAHAGDMAVGERRAVMWVPILEPTPEDDVVRVRAQADGAASFRRLEGIDAHDGAIVFTSTTGGRERQGQIFRLHPASSGGTLELIHEVVDPASMSMPDNVIVSPWGDLYLAEDGRRPCGIRCLGRNGVLRALAVGARSGGEIAGVCFTPEGDVLFANLQDDGITVAIVGPFERFGA